MVTAQPLPSVWSKFEPNLANEKYRYSGQIKLMNRKITLEHLKSKTLIILPGQVTFGTFFLRLIFEHVQNESNAYTIYYM